MKQHRARNAIVDLGALDRSAGGLVVQITNQLRRAIEKGAIQAGERLPSTRQLALELGVSRGSATLAFDQLVAEGYLVTVIGAGTRVVCALADTLTPPGQRAPAPAEAVRTTVGSERSSRLGDIARAMRPQRPIPFAIAAPMDETFPGREWRRLWGSVGRNGAGAGYADSQGDAGLRREIANYARRARGIQCTEHHVVVTAGTQQGLSLAAKIVLDQGDEVWAEDPGYPGTRAALEDAEARIAFVPVDQQGLDVAAGLAGYPMAKAAFVSPSHQYPLGMPMSMARQLALLGWAERSGGWIVEDDYDSEFRYVGRPIPSLRSLDGSGRVIYLGTFSKVLYPALRLGYAIVPNELAGTFASARFVADRHSNTSTEAVLAAYMREGHFEAHIRRMRVLYARRQRRLLDALATRLADKLTVQPCDQGMHVVAWLKDEENDVEVAQAASEAGLEVRPISPMFHHRAARHGLMLGFCGFTPDQIDAALVELERVLRAR